MCLFYRATDSRKYLLLYFGIILYHLQTQAPCIKRGCCQFSEGEFFLQAVCRNTRILFRKSKLPGLGSQPYNSILCRHKTISRLHSRNMFSKQNKIRVKITKKILECYLCAFQTYLRSIQFTRHSYSLKYFICQFNGQGIYNATAQIDFYPDTEIISGKWGRGKMYKVDTLPLNER